MREPKNIIEEAILVFDANISRLLTEQDACKNDERWGFLQIRINKLNERRAYLVKRFIDHIRDEFISSPNCRD